LAKIALFVIGAVFGWGLMIAGMSQRSKIYGFLELNSNWDPSLLFVLMTGVIINVITFGLIRVLVYYYHNSVINHYTQKKLKILKEKLHLD